MDDDDNIFDKDDALDYIMYKEVEKDSQNKPSNKGCLGMVVMFIIPLAGLGYSFFK